MSNTNTNLQPQTSSVLHNDTVSSCSTSKVQEKTQLSRSRCMNSLREVKSQFKFLTETIQDFGTMPVFKRTFSQDLDLLEQHLTKEIIYQTDCKTTLTKLRTTFENAFNSEFKERMQKYTRFDAQSLYDAMTFLSKDDLKGTRIEHGFKRAFMSLFGQDADTFTSTMLLNVDQLQKQLDKDEFQEDGSMAAFWYFVEYTGIEVKHFRDTLLQHMGNVKKYVAERTLDNGLVVMESNGTESEVQDDNSRSGNDTDIRPIYDEEPMAEVQLTAECNIFAIGKHHTEQPEIINEGKVDQYPEQRQVKSPMLDSSPDNQTTEYSKQSLESENILLKKTVAQLQKDFLKMEAHCIALELKYQNQALKSWQHGQILNETSNKAKIKKEIDVLETMNIELEHSVDKLRKENETLKKNYKDLYDSIKITRSKTIEQKTSLIANNADLKAQIQEKVFAIAALKNNLRKLKGNSVDSKFDNTLVLGKPVLQSPRNQSVVRQLNAFKSERPQMSKQWFASQVDVNNNFSKLATQHYLPKKRESVFVKPDHMIASSESTNSSKNMLTLSSNDMVHNHYLDEAKRKAQERDRNSNTSVTNSARFQSTADDSKLKPRSNNQTPRSFPISKSSCVTITVVPKHITLIVLVLFQIPKTLFVLHIPTRNLFDSCTSKVDRESPHGSNVDIPNIHECKQTLDVSAGTSINVQKKQSLDLSAESKEIISLHINEQEIKLGDDEKNVERNKKEKVRENGNWESYLQM
ncbi:hypothetical protein Tco_1174160 [Tanacetum coccineum]